MPFSLPAAMSRPVKLLVFTMVLMLLFSVGRILLYALNAESFADLQTSELLGAFINGLRFDASAVARWLAIPLLLLALPWRRLNEPTWFNPLAWLLFMMCIPALLLLVGDAIYFGRVGRHVSYELQMMQEDWGFLLDMLSAGYLGAGLAFVLLGIGLAWLWCRVLALPIKPFRYPWSAYLVLFVSLLVIGRGGVSGKVIEIIDAYDNGNSAYGHLSLNGVFTAMSFALNMGEAEHHFYSREKVLAAVDELRGIQAGDYPMQQAYEGPPTQYNVVFLLLESWNFIHVDSFGGEDYGVTPHFDRLAREGLRFTRFYAAGQRSIDGIQATVTGIPTLKGLPRIDTGIGVSNISRMGLLAREQGYETLFVQSSARDSYKLSGIAESSGFSHYYGREDMPMRRDYPGESSFGWDYETLMLFKEKLDGFNRPFLAYAYTGTTHEPYAKMPEPFNRHPHEPDGEGGYLNTLQYADWSLGEFMREARQAPWFDNTIFIFSADHANHLQSGDGLSRFHIPLLIYAPGIIEAGERTQIASQLDVMPTIVDLLGLEEDFSALGQSVFRQKIPYALISRGGQTLGLVTEQGYLFHSLKNSLESADWNKQPLAQTDQEKLEHWLLSLDQLTFELLKANRWAR